MMAAVGTSTSPLLDVDEVGEFAVEVGVVGAGVGCGDGGGGQCGGVGEDGGPGLAVGEAAGERGGEGVAGAGGVAGDRPGWAYGPASVGCGQYGAVGAEGGGDGDAEPGEVVG
ncbi:hypothetical protein GCM10029964_058360 [Kibdelosporangium lantanae]